MRIGTARGRAHQPDMPIVHRIAFNAFLSRGRLKEVSSKELSERGWFEEGCVDEAAVRGSKSQDIVGRHGFGQPRFAKRRQRSRNRSIVEKASTSTLNKHSYSGLRKQVVLWVAFTVVLRGLSTLPTALLSELPQTHCPL